MDQQLLRNAVRESGYKIKFLAEKAGVTPRTLSRWLSGTQGLGKSAQLLLASFLKLSPETLKKKAS